jgi:3-oxoacyl-[acyl-carrier-protein] synthase II
LEDRVSGSFVITGAGLVTAAGDTEEAVFAALSARVSLAGAIEGFDPKRYVSRKGVKDLSRTSQLACSAAAGNARGIEGVPPGEVGVVLGTAWGSLTTVIGFEREAYVQGVRFVDPILFTETVSNVPAGQVAIHYGWSAFNATVSSGSASGLAGIRQAVQFLDEERGSVAVAGGCDELNAPLLRTLPHGAAFGEAACFLTIERDEGARRRGARPLARIRGTASQFVPVAADAREAMGVLIRRVTERAGLALPDVDLVVSSACASNDRDGREAGAVLDVFGSRAADLPVLAPKSILGETWGASGALAVVIAIEAMRTSAVSGESSCKSMRNALILDTTDSGHQLGAIVSLVESHGART